MAASFTVADNYIMQDGEAIAEGVMLMDGMDGSACHWLPLGRLVMEANTAAAGGARAEHLTGRQGERQTG